jgi:peptide/nickel transport system substrate-binding protein
MDRRHIGLLFTNAFKISRTRLWDGLATVVFVLCTVSCSASEAPKHAINTLVVAQAGEPHTLNPLLHNDYNSYELDNLVYSMLLQQDATGHLVPDLATVVPSPQNGQISRDGLRITYRLRHDARWQDGRPVTSLDVAFTYRAIMNPHTAVPSRAGYDNIVRLETPDLYTVVITLKRRFSPILSFFLAPGQGYPVLPAHLLARYRSLDALEFNSLPVGSGPYRVVRWIRGDRLELAANRLYFAGSPQIDHLIIRYLPDNATIVNELRTGEADVDFMADPSEIAVVAGSKALKLRLHAIAGVQEVIINLQDSLMRDERLRHALALSINIPYIAQVSSHGLYSAHEAQRGQFYWAFDPRVPDPAYQPAIADRLLDAAGWRRVTAGLRSNGRRPLSVELAYIAGRPLDATIAAIVQQEARARGFAVKLKSYRIEQFVAPADLGGPLYGGKFQLALISGGFADPDVSHIYGCRSMAPNGYNFSRYCNPALDAAGNAAAATFDIPARIAAYSNVQRILQRDLPSIVMWQNEEIDIVSNRLAGFSPNIMSPFYHANKWRLDPK